MKIYDANIRLVFRSEKHGLRSFTPVAVVPNSPLSPYYELITIGDSRIDTLDFERYQELVIENHFKKQPIQAIKHVGVHSTDTVLRELPRGYYPSVMFHYN